MTPVERRVRMLLRAWPRPDRAERDEEILGTTLDLVPPGRRGLPLGLAASVVFGGLTARWRARPPIRHWWPYAVHGAGLPPRWHRWMVDDLFSPGWSRRMYARLLAVGTAPYVLGIFIWGSLASLVGRPLSWHPSIWDVVLTPFLWSLVGTITGAALGNSTWARRRRVRTLADSGCDEFGRPDPLARPRYFLTRRRRHGRDNPAALKWATELGAEMRSVGQLSEAVSLLSETFQRAKRVAPDGDDVTSAAGSHLAATLADQGRADDAVEVGREVMAVLRRLHGPDHECSLEASFLLGQYLRSAGHLEESLSLLADTFERAKRRLPDEDWPTWRTGHELALAFAEHGRVDDAIEVGREVLAARRRLHGPDHDCSLRAAANLGAYLRRAGRLDEATRVLQRTFEQGKRVEPNDEWPTWWSGDKLALVLAEGGHVDDAIEVGRQVLAARRRLHGQDHNSSLRTATNLGGWLHEAGRLDDAIELLSDTFERACSTGCADALVDSGIALAKAYSRTNRHEEARLFARAVISEAPDVDSLGPDRAVFLRSLAEPFGDRP